eukprot:TRINITY_DN16825_c0_g1_i2.p1 TRINITY_DN16825_c0_g1~~TRINITY_DN16825_c0_g1_i2.p1  ORF type:complete len:1188 (+),score=290.61 TRINITY_DN16825_c0_g1_i2:146-3709(+)
MGRVSFGGEDESPRMSATSAGATESGGARRKRTNVHFGAEAPTPLGTESTNAGKGQPHKGADPKLNPALYAAEQATAKRMAFPWVQKEGSLATANKPINISGVVHGYGVPRDMVENYCYKEIRQADSFLSLGATLILIVSYSLVVLTHDNSKSLITVEESVVQHINNQARWGFMEDIGLKTFDDVNSAQDVWSWLVHGLVPLLWSPATAERLLDFSEANFTDLNVSYFKQVNDINIGELPRADMPKKDWYPYALQGWSTVADFSKGLVRSREHPGVPAQVNVSGLQPDASYFFNIYQFCDNASVTTTLFVNGEVYANTTTVGWLAPTASGIVVASSSGRIDFRFEFDDPGLLDEWDGKTYTQVTLSGLALARAIPESHASMPTRAKYTEEPRGKFLHYNKLLGGVRLRRETLNNTIGGCTGPSERLDMAYGKLCVGVGPYELDPDYLKARQTTDPDGEQWLWLDLDAEDIHAKLLDMERQSWLSDATSKVEIAMPLFNAHHGLHVILYINFFFSRGGQVWKQLIPMSIFAKWQDVWYKVLLEMLWCLCLVGLMSQEFLKMFRIFLTKGICRLIGEYSDVHNLLEWFGVMCGGSIILTFYYVIESSESVNEVVMSLLQDSRSNEWPAYRRVVSSVYLPTLEEGVTLASWFRLMMAAYPLVILLRLYNGFDAQPRLAIFSRTIAEASTDVIHLVVIFLCILTIFAIVAATTFGRRLADYTTYDRTMHSLFIMTLGKFDWDQMKVVGQAQAAFFLWVFMIASSFILMSMILAMIMEAYTVVLKEAGDRSRHALWIELRRAVRRVRAERRGDLVPLRTIAKSIRNEVSRLQAKRMYMQEVSQDGAAAAIVDISGANDLEIITIDLLLNLVENLQEKQARELLMKACHSWYEHSGDANRVITNEELDEDVSVLETQANLLDHAMHINPGKDAEDSAGDRTYMIRSHVGPLWMEIGKFKRDWLVNRVEQWEKQNSIASMTENASQADKKKEQADKKDFVVTRNKAALNHNPLAKYEGPGGKMLQKRDNAQVEINAAVRRVAELEEMIPKASDERTTAYTRMLYWRDELQTLQAEIDLYARLRDEARMRVGKKKGGDVLEMLANEERQLRYAIKKQESQQRAESNTHNEEFLELAAFSVERPPDYDTDFEDQDRIYYAGDRPEADRERDEYTFGNIRTFVCSGCMQTSLLSVNP